MRFYVFISRVPRESYRERIRVRDLVLRMLNLQGHRWFLGGVWGKLFLSEAAPVPSKGGGAFSKT